MNCRGLLVLVVGLVALEAGVVSPALQVAGALMALITTVMTAPVLARTIDGLSSVPGVGALVAQGPRSARRAM